MSCRYTTLGLVLMLTTWTCTLRHYIFNIMRVNLEVNLILIENSDCDSGGLIPTTLLSGRDPLPTMATGLIDKECLSTFAVYM